MSERRTKRCYPTTLRRFMAFYFHQDPRMFERLSFNGSAKMCPEYKAREMSAFCTFGVSSKGNC